MKLYIMRHGEAAAPDKSSEQVLTPGGKAGIERLAQRLTQEQLHLEHVFHSGKERAKQTAEIMIRIISPGLTPKVLENIKPEDEPGLIIPAINDWTEDSLITSHLPFIPNLVTLLTATDSHLANISYVPGTIICLEKNNTGWTISWATSP